jgi:PIN domain nuclease of toxin-antitoxin system
LTADDKGLLLDTHAAIWLADGRLDKHLGRELTRTASEGRLFVSPATALEIGFLTRPSCPAARRLDLLPDPVTWFSRFLIETGSQLTEFTPEIAIRSSFLPGEFHKDPIDRLLVSTARELGLRLITRDAAILAYSAEGHVRTLAC